MQWVPKSVEANWNFLTDLQPQFGIQRQSLDNVLDGVLWSHVTSFSGSNAALVQNLNNHYRGMTVREVAPVFLGDIPALFCGLDCYGLWPDPLHDPDQSLVSPWLFGFQSNTGPQVVEAVGKKNRLRLLTLNPDGVASELWRTKPVKKLPERATLTISADGDIVLGLVGRPSSDWSEVLLLDGFGKPILSGDFHRRLVHPALSIPAGIDLPFERQKGDSLPIRDELRPRSDFSTSICGAKWLRASADKLSPILISKGCKESEDEQDESDD